MALFQQSSRPPEGQGIVSLHVAQDVVSRSNLLKLSNLPLKKLKVGSCVYHLSEFLVGMPCLEQLDVWIQEPESSTDLIGLNTLHEVILHVN